MLHRVIGSSGSGKTEYILARLGEALKKGKQCYVIVPEQQSVSYEAMLCERFGDGVNLLCEVLNFERLPNRIAREFGGLAVKNIDKGGACALLSLVAESLKDELKEYSTVASDPDFALSLYSLISGMKMALITPELITNALKDENIRSDERITKKLSDILLIYNEYAKHFSDELCDPRDALTLLSEEIKSKDFFKNTCVFIDSYYTFTEQEYRIIKEIVSQSSECYISFTVDYNKSFFDENKKASERVFALAHRISDDHYTGSYRRSSKESLKYIENNLWESNVKVSDADPDGVKILTAKNRFDEVEAIAAEILGYVRNGNRFRDITLLTGNVNAYAPIVDSVFERAGIPLYMSSKEDLSSKPLFAYLLASISVITEDFSLRSVKRYIKSGYTELTVSESDALLSYASSWNLRGKAWYSSEEWTLDPEGYRESDISERGAKLLKTANKARDIVIAPLAALRDSLTQKNLTVGKALRALYSHLISTEADEKLRKNAEFLLKNGDREGADREIQLWKILINIIDQLDNLVGEREITPKRMSSLIKLMCECYSLGAIPSYADAVTFGDASLIRAGGSKMVAVLGVCDGEFPATTQNGSFFDRDEAVLLESVGITIADTMEKQLNTNRFFVYAAFSAPTESLVISYPRSELAGGDLRPSTALLSVENMFSTLKSTDFDPETELYSCESIAANFPLIQDNELRQKLENALNSKGVSFYKEIPAVTDTVSRINFKEDILKLSPSKFETYANCPFSFFGNYLLELMPKKKNEFSMSEIGNFAHKMLDHFMRECVTGGKFVCPSDEELESRVKDLADVYFENVIGPLAKDDKAFMHVYENAIKTVNFVAKNLCEEFSKSDFLPTGFEYRIGLKNPDTPAIEHNIGGKLVHLRGSIDRVDTYTSGGEKYVRVVDYKTYDKSFSAQKVAYGLDSQLLHYLYAYCDRNSASPAGVFYYTITLPNVSINGRESEEKIAAEIKKTIKRNGIMLDNVDVARAMSNDFSCIPAKLNDEGALYTRGTTKKLYSKDDFDNLKTLLGDKLISLAGDVFHGKMDIAPLKCEEFKAEPCKYCSLGDLCRNKQQEQEDEEDEQA